MEPRRSVTYDRIAEAQVYPAGTNLHWVQAIYEQKDPDGTAVDRYPFWLLVQQGTDRVMSEINGPSEDCLTYMVTTETGARRAFISLDGAQRYAMFLAGRELAAEQRRRPIMKGRRSSRLRARR